MADQGLVQFLKMSDMAAKQFTKKWFHYPHDTRRLLLQTFVVQHCCTTFVARLSWTVAVLHNKLCNPNLNSNLCNNLRKTLRADWSLVVCLLFAL